LKIAEDEKCVYSMIVTTPVACDGAGNGNKSKKEKDEL
jgi:protein kinase C substrate 80K-H